MLLFIQPAWLSLQCFYSFASFLIYTLTIILMSRDRETFKGTFFTIYKVTFFVNLLSYIASFIIVRFPHHTCKDCWLDSFYTDENYMAPISMLAWVDMSLKIAQSLLVSMYILNRYFALLSMEVFDKSWLWAYPVCLIAIVSGPFIATRKLVLNKPQEAASMDEDLKYVIVAFFCGNIAFCLVSMIQKDAAIQGVTSKNRSLHFCLMFCQIIVIIVTIVLNKSYLFPLINDALWWRVTDFTFDILTCSQPWIYLLNSPTMRTRLIEMITPFTWNFSPRTPDSDETLESDDEGIPLQDLSRETSVDPAPAPGPSSTSDDVDADAKVDADADSDADPVDDTSEVDVCIKPSSSKNEKREQSEEPNKELLLAVPTTAI